MSEKTVREESKMLIENISLLRSMNYLTEHLNNLLDELEERYDNDTLTEEEEDIFFILVDFLDQASIEYKFAYMTLSDRYAGLL